MSVAGLIVRRAGGTHAEVLRRVDAALAARGLDPLARIDHAAAAARVGLSLAPCTLFVFGDPRSGTVLMQTRATLGLDLPLRLLVWEEVDGVRIAYDDPAWLVERHEGDASAPVLLRMRGLLDAIAGEAAA
jgi:uncharacterized protein (DUF302 family)